MTQEQYYAMCEQLGSEPKDEEVPLDIRDFPELVQLSYDIFRRLPDEWEPMNGTCLGKNKNNLFNLLELFGISDREEIKLAIDFIAVFENSWRTIINNKNKAKTSKKPR